MLDVQDGWIRVDWGGPDSRLEKLKPLPSGLYARETMDLDVLDEDELVGFVADYGVPGWWPWRALPHGEPHTLSFANEREELLDDFFGHGISVRHLQAVRQAYDYADLHPDQPVEMPPLWTKARAVAEYLHPDLPFDELPSDELPEPDWPFNDEDDFRSHRETEHNHRWDLTFQGFYPPPPFTPDKYDEFLGQVHVSEVQLHLIHLRDMVR
ncbi:MAG: hypothetical protein GX537_04915, partial [Actinobacteria bacterium]|nr:hypothetical protein [Actinomycetota bacterium]